MKFVIAGGTGAIGSNLIKQINKQHEIIILTRGSSRKISDKIKLCNYSKDNINKWSKELVGCDVLINLVGESIDSLRWSKKKKNNILKSRLEAIKNISDALDYSSCKPKMIISASATGYYENTTQRVDESGLSGKNFLAFVAKHWEKHAYEKFVSKTNKLVILRIGVVLDRNSGMLSKILPLFRLGLGAILGNGKQFLSWIHIDDVVQSIVHIIKNNLEGTINLVAPNTIDNYSFSKKIGQLLKRPVLFKVPSIVLKGILGEMSILLLNSSNIYPKALIESNFKFKFKNIDEALNDLIK